MKNIITTITTLALSACTVSYEPPPEETCTPQCAAECRAEHLDNCVVEPGHFDQLGECVKASHRCEEANCGCCDADCAAECTDEWVEFTFTCANDTSCTEADLAEQDEATRICTVACGC